MSFSQLAELASDGTLIYPNMSTTGEAYGRDAQGRISTITITQYGVQWVKTLTYTAAGIDNTGLWVRQ